MTNGDQRKSPVENPAGDPVPGLGRALAQAVGEAQRERHLHARTPADRVSVHLGQPPDVAAREAPVQLLADREAEHSVAQEREPPVGLDAGLDP